ncbi:cell division protein FtsZ [Methyloligella sp. 2.7D]|uniref:cell division protein FtsZ n=1 Tax=unclassified Methyloligella TaxID=2625955 RepID=UPI00157C42F1|nr:cell division protein FtsZ [Methyloligella sp. GL2]QKP77986.1 cell division protein FtsZ [Methyloligella sp. GL2]
MTINLKVPDVTELKPRITVFGVGGAGGNAVNNMIAAGVEGVDFVVANTDAQALHSSTAERRVQMGTNVTEGLGAGSKPEIGAAAAEEAMADIKSHLTGSHMVFITAGMGGGTGTGAAPVIARASREEGILTVGVVTKPFQFEGVKRLRSAESGISELEQYVDTLLVIPNQNLFRVANEKTTFSDAFAMADDVLRSGVSCITDLMVKEGLINLDFADVRTIMAGMGKAMMGTGESSGERRAVEAADAAISNPLLDDVSMRGASGLLVSITGGNDLTLYEVDEAASRIRAEADEDANIIVGATFDDKLDGVIRVSVVATGLGPVDFEATVPEERQESAEEEPLTLTERLAGLSAMPPSIGGKREATAEEKPAAPRTENQAPLWQAPGNVTIERRPAPAPRAQAPAAEKPAAPAPKFSPAPPASAARPVRRMPNVDELPVVAQNEIRAKSGDHDAQGLDAHKRKVGFLERLAGVALRKEDEEDDSKHEPNFGEPQLGEPRRAEPKLADPEEAPAAPAPRAEQQGGAKIVRPQESAPERGTDRAGVTPMPKRASLKRRADLQAEGSDESENQDDLEIPAFLRRQAN